MSMLAERKRKTKYMLNHGRRELWKTDDSFGMKFGKDLMERMGWKAGQGLGINKQGIKEPLKINHKIDNKGVGFKDSDDQWIQQQQDFNKFLSELSTNIGAAVEEESLNEWKEKKIQSLEEKSKLSKSRVHYHRFTRGKDLSKYTEKDLECILGKTMDDDHAHNLKSDHNNVEEETDHLTINNGSMVDYFAMKIKNKNKNVNIKNSHVESVLPALYEKYSAASFLRDTSEYNAHKHSDLQGASTNKVENEKERLPKNYEMNGLQSLIELENMKGSREEEKRKRKTENNAVQKKNEVCVNLSHDFQKNDWSEDNDNVRLVSKMTEEKSKVADSGNVKRKKKQKIEKHKSMDNFADNQNDEENKVFFKKKRKKEKHGKKGEAVEVMNEKPEEELVKRKKKEDKINEKNSENVEDEKAIQKPLTTKKRKKEKFVQEDPQDALLEEIEGKSEKRKKKNKLVEMDAEENKKVMGEKPDEREDSQENFNDALHEKIKGVEVGKRKKKKETPIEDNSADSKKVSCADVPVIFKTKKTKRKAISLSFGEEENGSVNAEKSLEFRTEVNMVSVYNVMNSKSIKQKTKRKKLVDCEVTVSPEIRNLECSSAQRTESGFTLKIVNNETHNSIEKLNGNVKEITRDKYVEHKGNEAMTEIENLDRNPIIYQTKLSKANMAIINSGTGCPTNVQKFFGSNLGILKGYGMVGFIKEAKIIENVL